MAPLSPGTYSSLKILLYSYQTLLTAIKHFCNAASLPSLLFIATELLDTTDKGDKKDGVCVLLTLSARS